jgi:hypothetical protein
MAKQLASGDANLDQGGDQSAGGESDVASELEEGAEHEEGEGQDGDSEAGEGAQDAEDDGQGDEQGEAESEASGEAGPSTTDAELAKQTRELLSFLQQQAQGGAQDDDAGQGQQGDKGGQPKEFTPVIGEDFIRKAAEHMDEGAIDSVVKPLAKIINAQAEALHKFQQQTAPHIQRFEGHFKQVQAQERQREHAGVHSWFDKLKGAEARYGTPAKCSDGQFANRDRVYRSAKLLRQASHQRAKTGAKPLDWPTALKLAHAADSHEETTSQATQQIRGTLKKRARGITVPPGRRGTQGGGSEGGEDKAARTAVKNFVKTRHNAD